ncbi:hypothetical protein KY389_01715 [Paracoccus bogoriensis]|uniref:hypothetical protein n=1 Tax=Paracoccus bogoriensis TaxID=242065 RepID=UPI001CA52CF5|nr:hypothetical protein [Paracoccus bogoriensis]MBW7055413.1 hypothetical protein [Paracoccus bogoriensis]
MIRAHMASFPPRSAVVRQAVASLLPQVDRLFLCLNQFDSVPGWIADEPKIEAMIPPRDLKDAGKFAFEPDPDDWVFTVDDDIAYPPDYVAATLAQMERLDPETSVIGHLGNAWQERGKLGQMGWKTIMFWKRSPHLMKVDVLGTGTTCQLGRNLPRLDQIENAAGFVDLRHARLHAKAGRWLWVSPHERDWMRSLMTDDLRPTSLFDTVNRRKPPAMMAELAALIGERSPHSGLHHGHLVKKGLLRRKPMS